MPLQSAPHRPIVRASRGLLVTIALGGLLACSTPGPKALTVDEIDTFYPQQPAVIALSDPQIYSRETLVNDRREEAEYLEDLLEASGDPSKVKFEPQIRRDLRMLSSIVAQLEASFDPLAGRAAGRQEDLADVDQQIEETKRLTALAEARARLHEAEARLDAIERGEEVPEAGEDEDAPESTSAATMGGGGGDEGEGGDGGDDEAGGDGGGDERELEALRADVEGLKTLLVQLAGSGPVRPTDVGSTPREDFRDRQAYREELRAARAEVLLDDGHDRGQNSLYRLQFRATVVPGRYASKVGVARLTLDRPTLSEDQILELYKTWLGHVTYRLNQPVGDRLQADPSYLLLAMGLENGLFHVVSLPVDGGMLWIALPPEAAMRFRRQLEPPTEGQLISCRDTDGDASECEPTLKARWRKLGCRVRKLRELTLAPSANRDLAGCLGLDSECRVCPGASEGAASAGDMSIAEALKLVGDLSYVEPFFSASVRGLGDLGLLKAKPEIDDLIRDMAGTSEVLDHFRRRLEEECSECRGKVAPGGSEEAVRGQVPEAFKRVLRFGGDSRLAGGDAFVYATTPVELAQQVSTTASALRSFELALGITAALQTSGVGAEGGFNSLQAAQSSLEARERLPIVVGFAEREVEGLAMDPDAAPNQKACGYPPCPQFGWLFGPQAGIDAEGKRLRLHQPVVNHTVTADVSVPGWWPQVRVTAETAWIGDWQDGRMLLRPGRSLDPWNWPEKDPRRQVFKIHLPLNRADLDGLTELLAQKTVGGALPYTKVSAVSPSAVAPCAKEVTLLVYGANVWRSTEVYLNGLIAKPVRVLPDMAGVAATFEHLDRLPRDPEHPDRALLTVWTRDGAASAHVTLERGKPDGPPCAAPSAPAPLRLALASHHLIGKDGKVKVRAVQGSLPGSFYRLSIGLRPGPEYRWSPSLDDTAQVSGGVVEGGVDLDHVTFQRELDDAGTLLTASLLEEATPVAEPTRRGVEGRLVYYGSEDDADVDVVTKVLTDLDQPVVLKLPKHHAIAFPDLVGGKCRFVVKIEGSTCKLAIRKMEPQAIVRDTSKVALHLAMDGDPKKAPCKGQHKATAAFAADPACKDRPAIGKHDLTVGTP